MGSFGFEEMLLVAVVAILIYGRDLPRVARQAAKWYAKLRNYLDGLKEEVKRHIPEEDIEAIRDLRSIREDVNRSVKEEPPAEPAAPDATTPVESPSAGLPGPDPSDPEYRPDQAEAFDPSRPAPDERVVKDEASDVPEPKPKLETAEPGADSDDGAAEAGTSDESPVPTPKSEA